MSFLGSLRSAFFIATGAALSLAGGAQANDFANLHYNLLSGPDGITLRGQSAFIQSRTNSATSGGQLDGSTGAGVHQFTEVFPEPLLSDYLTFSYIGILESPLLDEFGDAVVDEFGNPVFDNSLVIGFESSAAFSAEGLRVEDLYPGTGYSESVLVDAFTNSFDSPEFFDMAFGQVGGNPATSAAIGLFEALCTETICDTPTEIRPTSALILMAFTGGLAGDEATSVGDLAFSITRATLVPEPTTALLVGLGLGGLAWRGRRAD